MMSRTHSDTDNTMESAHSGTTMVASTSYHDSAPSPGVYETTTTMPNTPLAKSDRPHTMMTYSGSNTEYGDRFSGSTLGAGSVRFRDSTYQIPDPKKPPKRGWGQKPTGAFNPLILRLPLVIGTPLIMLFLGIALEIAIFISNHQNGFKVPVNNVFNMFGNVSAQFLASFFPTLLILPNAFAWRELDWNIRWYQPYLVLQRGNALAEESLLLDYIELGPTLSLFRALNYKHRIVFWSSLTAVMTYAFQPLSGSIFQIRSVFQTDTITVPSIRSIGLATDGITDLNSFMAAAGYTDASAVLDTIGDPPFVFNGWATAEALFPAKYINGTVTVTTSGIQSTANCSNSVGPPTLSTSANGNVTLAAISVDGCNATAQFNSSLATNQYGVRTVPCPGPAVTETDVRFLPVMFWYYNLGTNQQAKAVFCTPTIQAFEVEAKADLNNGSLISVTGQAPYKIDNNVTGGDQKGRAFNGVIFPQDPNPFIDIRRQAIASILPGAIFKAALRSPGGLDATFGKANGFLDLTSEFYTRHLSLTAQTVYFVEQNSTLTGATVKSLVPRLVIDPLPAHALAIILVLIGIIGLPLHIRHRAQRKKLLLATPPGTIASIVALTARSGFGELLLPYDDELTLEKKLDGLRFRLDARTGAIVADDTLSERVGMGADDAMMSLMGGKMVPPNSASESSSLLAYQAAAGDLNWGRSWAPPGSAEPQYNKSPLSRTEFNP